VPYNFVRNISAAIIAGGYFKDTFEWVDLNGKFTNA
jgi:hypothetical protein